ncbi:MAG: 7TM-DISM domain-containing protein [Oligoflexus sp.]
MKLLPFVIIYAYVAMSPFSLASPVPVLHLSQSDFAESQIVAIEHASWQFSNDLSSQASAELKTNPFQAFWFKETRHTLGIEERQGYLSLHLYLDQASELALQIPDYPFYRFYLNGKLHHQHGDMNSDGEIQAKRSYEIINLGNGQHFHLQFFVVFDDSVWMQMPPLRLAEPRVFRLEMNRLLVIQNLIIGILLVTAIYQLSLFFLVPDRKAPLYCSLFLFVLMLRSALTGQAQPVNILIPNFDWEWSWKLGFIGYYTSVPLILSFFHALFPGTMPAATPRYFWLPALLFTGISLLTNVGFYGSINGWYQIITLLALAITLRSFYLAFRRRMIGSKVMIAAIGALLIATVNDILFIAGFIKSFPLLEFGLVIFVITQTIIVSMKFSHAYHKINHINGELRKIVYDHVIGRISAGESIETTMPTGYQKATVLCFDIVKSSKVQHPDFPLALERVMARCTMCLNEHYDQVNLQANGYRIKEMGDGLLASIGFPFACPNEQNSCELALVIAKSFCEIFREEMLKLNYSEDLFCSVGLAHGDIEGFYPRQGIRQYDVRGRALTLATRYESMRNIVYDKFGRQGSVIFIQDCVYRNLSPKTQQCFQHWNCQDPQARIRDDQKATQAWFQFVEAATRSDSDKVYQTSA